VYRSEDAGNSWAASGAVTASDVVDLSGRPDGGLLVLTRSGTVWESLDGGVTFGAVGTITAPNCASLVVGANEALYTLTRTGEVAESIDGGATWSTVGTIPVSDAVGLRRFDADLFVLTGTGTTYRSDDDGATWGAVGTVSQVGMTGLSQVTNRLVAVSKEGLVARSTDGTDWSWVGTVNQVNVIALANDSPQVTGVPDAGVVPARLVLASLRPNPRPPGRNVVVEFVTDAAGSVALQFFDVRGGMVLGLPAVPLSHVGEHAIAWDPGSLPSGRYYLRLLRNDGVEVSAPLTVLR
jgi:hypothetical protein